LAPKRTAAWLPEQIGRTFLNHVRKARGCFWMLQNGSAVQSTEARRFSPVLLRQERLARPAIKASISLQDALQILSSSSLGLQLCASCFFWLGIGEA